MRFREPKGQTTVEFAFAGVWLILLMMAVLCFGFITFQKSSFDYQVSHMADELPSGWESMDAKQVVKSCVAKASGLSEDDIEVNTAEIHLEDKGNTDLGNDTAVQLGSELKTTTAHIWTSARTSRCISGAASDSPETAESPTAAP